MAFIADILMGAGAVGAGIFCLVLSRRLAAFSTLEGGMGGAIALLSAQVDDLTQVLAAARTAADQSAAALEERTRRAEESAARLELLLATLHDLPDPSAVTGPKARRISHRSNVRRSSPMAGAPEILAQLEGR